MVHLLSSNAFSGQLSPPKSVGVSPIFRAKIRAGDESHRCYVKPITDQIRCPVTQRIIANQELIAEALGYALAKAAGLKVPDVAGIILLDREQIPRALWPALTATACGSEQRNYFCWFSRDMDLPSLKQRYLGGIQLPALDERRLKRLTATLANNPDSPKVIAFDAWLQNSDRNVGNLLDSSPDSLMLIDHGRILRFPNWSPGSLGTPPERVENKLQWLIDKFTSGWSSLLPNKSAMVMAYNGFAISFRQEGEQAARKVLSEFFEQVDTDAIIQLLHEMLDTESYTKETGLIA